MQQQWTKEDWKMWDSMQPHEQRRCENMSQQEWRKIYFPDCDDGTRNVLVCIFCDEAKILKTIATCEECYQKFT
jgi:hypothetical protein